MDSTARNSDIARKRNTREKILDAAHALVTNSSEASSSFLTEPTRTALAKQAGIHVQTFRKHFRDWAEVCAALAERYRITPGMTTPDNVRHWAQEHYDREGRDKIIAAPVGTDELRNRFAAATMADDDTELAESGLVLVQTLSGRPVDMAMHAREIIECAKTVRARLDASSNHQALNSALQINDVAVQAHRHLAKGPGGHGNSASERVRLLQQISDDSDGDTAEQTRQMVDRALHEPRHLQAIVRIKRWDQQISERLGLRVRAVLSKFHSARAEAMIGNLPEDEIAALREVVLGLRRLQKGEHPEYADTSDIVMLVARLAGVSLAYADQLKDGELAETRTDLLRLFRTNDHENRQLKVDAQALFKLVDGEPVEATGLLRALRFQGPGDYLIARYLADQAELSDQDIVDRFGTSLGPPDHVRILLLNRACTCYERVSTTSRVSGCAARLAGMSQADISAARAKIRNLSGDTDLPTTPTGEQTIEHLLRNINDLVHRAVLGNVMDKRQVGTLVNALDPIRTFLMGRAIHRL
ncbi:hypothetical protein ACFVVM_16480 [Nocardia sp. NPDC058176]|uniref:hypothetical protein n=1 Tax=Nocardia sp. NPDC058176 TaxID=3346368 RepID=UPI0036DF688D